MTVASLATATIITNVSSELSDAEKAGFGLSYRLKSGPRACGRLSTSDDRSPMMKFDI